MDNFSSIGFGIRNDRRETYYALYAVDEGTIIDFPKGRYHYCRDNTGVELWSEFNNRDAFVSVNTHFRGESERQVLLNTEVKFSNAPLTKSFFAVGIRLGKWGDPTYPILFDLPNFRLFQKDVILGLYTLQLTAFPNQINYYKNKRQFEKYEGVAIKDAPYRFIPEGLLNAAYDNAGDKPTSYSSFAGTIVQCQRLTNGITNKDFYWMLVDTHGGEIDVVADITFFDVAPKVNGLISGDFYLSGRILDKEEIEGECPEDKIIKI